MTRLCTQAGDLRNACRLFDDRQDRSAWKTVFSRMSVFLFSNKAGGHPTHLCTGNHGGGPCPVWHDPQAAVFFWAGGCTCNTVQ